MIFDLIDYQPKGKQINRDQTGTFGSFFETGGILGRGLSLIKNHGVRLPVLSFSYANALLREAGHQVRIITDRVPDSAADVMIFATTMYHYKEDLAFIADYRAQHSKTKIGVIGGFSKSMPQYYEGKVDFFINSDIEQPIRDFLHGDWKWEGTYIPKEALDLKTLPIPSWEGFPLDHYSYSPALPKKRFSVIQASRGCAFNCTFCPYMVTQDAKVKGRDITHIEKEIKYLAKLGVKSILFRDILFGVPQSRGEEIADLFKTLNLGIEWATEMHINTLNEAYIDRMIKGGWKVVNLGIESSDPEVLGKSGKRPISIQKVVDTVNYLNKRGIKVQGFYIFGLMHDTVTSMENTLAFAKQLNTFSAQFCVATPFPGTRFYEEVKGNLLTTDWSQYTEYEPVIKLPNVTPDQIRSIRDKAYSTYYMRPNWIMKHGPKVMKDLLRL